MPGVVVKHEDDLEVKYGGAFSSFSVPDEG